MGLVDAPLNRGSPIGPAWDKDWPGERCTPLYWVARGECVLAAVPTSAGIRVAADRHYQLYINGRRVARQRGFFNGDEYLFAQTWTDGVAAFLQPGLNRIELVIRSDPWRNKNYRCHQPMAILEMYNADTPDSPLWVTDTEWDVAIVEGWREQIALAGCGTIDYERVHAPTDDKAFVCGVPANLNWTKARVLPRVAANTPPRMLLWNDPPKREDVIPADRVVARGDCEIPAEVLMFPVNADDNGKISSVLRAEFDDFGGTSFSLATSAMFRHVIHLNGLEVVRFDDIPSGHNMPLPDWLMPRGRFVTRPGVNVLEITIDAVIPWHKMFRVTSTALPVLREPRHWTLNQAPVDCEIQSLEPSEAFGAKGTWEDESVFVESSPARLLLRATRERKAFAVVDMGKLVRGYLRLRVRAASAGRVSLAYGFEHHHGCVDAHRMHIRACDVLEIAPGETTYEAFDIRTFRFVDMIFEGFEGEITVFDIETVEPVFVDDTRSDFDAEDATTNAIFQASRRTAQVCTDELYVDNAEREHAQWSDAIVCGALSGYYLFGEYRKAEKALEEIALSQQPDGQLPGYAPGAWFPRLPLQCHMSLFAMAFCDHYRYTGDEAFGRRMLGVIGRMIEHWLRYRRGDGLLADLHTVFVDWGSHIYSYGRGCKGPTGALTTMNCYYLGVLRKTAEMARHLGEDSLARQYDEQADEIRDTIREKLYVAKAGCFRDGVDNERAEKTISQTANTLAVLFGAAPEGKESTVLNNTFGPNRPADIIPANAFFSWQVGQAMFNHGCDDLAMQWLRDGLTPMLSHPAGTLWETWEPVASQCQATGAGPAFLFARYLAGLYPAAPGYAKIGVDPHPAGLRHLRCRLTTPHGPVDIAWDYDGTTIDYRLALPSPLRNAEIVAPQHVKTTITAGREG